MGRRKGKGPRKHSFGCAGEHAASFRRLLAGVIVMLGGPLAIGQEVLYVKLDAAGANDGSSWVDAYADLQDAIDRAHEIAGGAPVEIWVAAGVYKPDRGTGDRTASFELLNNVAIYGGFAGWETRRDQRDRLVNETILSGDLNGDDDPNAGSDSDCCYSIRGDYRPGCDDEACEQIVCEEEPWCCDHFWDATCAFLGQTMCCELCRTTRCENSHTVVGADGTDSTAVLDGVTVGGGEANQQRGSDDPHFAYGGGLYGDSASSSITNCIFTANAGLYGTAAHIRFGEPTFAGCLFIENVSYFSDLDAALEIRYDDPTITDCAFIRNIGGGLRLLSDGTPTIRGCGFVENTAPGFKLHGGAPNIVDCTFIGNTAPAGAGMAIYHSSLPQLINCAFYGNTAQARGGAVYSNGNGVILVNCIFSGNSAGSYGGAVNHGLGSALVLGCTFVGNSAPTSPGGLSNGGSIRIANSIFWGNTSESGGTGQIAQIYNGHTTTFFDIDYTCVQGWDGSWGGQGNVGLDPLFVDADGPDDIVGTDDDNLRLSSISPLINAGDPDPPLVPYLDADGHTRILCGRLDMGAYEFGIGDFDCDRAVDLTDFAAWPSCMTGPEGDSYPNACEAFDFDADDDIDLSDFAAFQQACPGP